MLLHEGRIDCAVPAAQIGLAETVVVATKMGSEVNRGKVKATSPEGLVLVCSDGDREIEQFFSEQLYMFLPEEGARPEPPLAELPHKRDLNDLGPDDRVRYKLGISEADKDVDEEGNDAPGAEDDDGKKDKEKGKGKEKDRKGPPESKIDTSKLPDDIKNAIISAKEMEPDTVNVLLSEVGDAAAKALKRAGVSETEVFGLAQKISDAVYGVLTKQGLASDTLRDERGLKK